jgi:hypothetical protein
MATNATKICAFTEHKNIQQHDDTKHMTTKANIYSFNQRTSGPTVLLVVLLETVKHNITVIHN